MIQDIAPDRLDNAFAARAPRADDLIFLFDGNGRLYVRISGGRISFPAAKEVSVPETVYLFSVNDVCCFMPREAADVSLPGYEYRTVRELRDLGQGKELFAAFCMTSGPTRSSVRWYSPFISGSLWE